MDVPPLFEKLREDAYAWRQKGYGGTEFPLISEILGWQTTADTAALGQKNTPPLRFLRPPQFMALEVYWYVRLVHKTPRILDLYSHYYRDNQEFFEAIGIPLTRGELDFATRDKVMEKVRNDPDWVKRQKAEALREAIMLAYPSYILALAMGAGKTALIGAIIATEFAMALHYPKGKFMQNALVFAPGTTIIHSLRELSDLPYEDILPPQLYRMFSANVKIEFADKGKNICVQKSSRYNLIVTNTEKISLRARTRTNQSELDLARKEVEANLRLQTITGLPNLGIFSDEAHHTYGNTYDRLKRVRQTIDYIDEHTRLVAVINTTGTPYYKKRMLREVLVWYGLGDGIRDNILKDLENGVRAYGMKDKPEEEVFTDIIREFFHTHGTVVLPNGAKAKIAIYFKTQDHLDRARPFIEQAMTAVGESPATILINTQQSLKRDVDEFKRLNNPGNQKRVILLIAKGVEGWNCPSLFACALIKEQSGKNYVLQAATRCLRQVPGNRHSARLFLDLTNSEILDKELRANFGTDLGRMMFHTPDMEIVPVRILKTDLPPLEITRTVKRAVRDKNSHPDITLTRPNIAPPKGVMRSRLTVDFDGPREMLLPSGDTVELPAGKAMLDCHSAAWKIATRYHAPVMSVLQQLRSLYPDGDIPPHHLAGVDEAEEKESLMEQVEGQQANYEIIEEQVTEAMALIRLQDENGREVFEKDKNGAPIHRLRIQKSAYQRMKAEGLLTESEEHQDKHRLSFHYTPYNFDSQPESSLFQQVLSMLNTDPDDIQAFLFSGGLTDPNKTDFHFEYFGKDKRYHRYFPDFVLVKKTGEFFIIEVKAEHERGNPTVDDKHKAVERLRDLQPQRFKYHIVYTPSAKVAEEEMKPITDWVNTPTSET